MSNFRDKANFIWSVADLLRGDYKQSDYGKVILPFTILRRLDCLLEPTKSAVLAAHPKFHGQTEQVVDLALNKVSGQRFHNHSKYSFNSLVADANNIAAN